MKSFTLNQLPTVKNGTLTVTYTVGAGHKKTPYTLYSGTIAKSVSLDLNAIPSDARVELTALLFLVMTTLISTSQSL